METFVLVTYILALCSLAISIYVLVELRDLKREIRRQRVEKKLQQITQPKTKSLWK